MKEKLYPLKFQPIYKERIWGGTKLRRLLGKNAPEGIIGESWEISCVPENVSIVSNGPFEGVDLKTLITKFKGALVGEGVYEEFKEELPLLIKFLDAEKDLSIQVHPNDEMAKKYHSKGKTEMWYILEADKEAKLITGLQGVGKLNYKEKVSGFTDSDLVTTKVNAGESYFIPSRTVHAIGKGILLAEIQQTSDITFRIYDYNRTDSSGNKREIHTNEALEVIDFEARVIKSEAPKNEGILNLTNCEFFCTNKISYSGNLKRDYSHTDSFVILIGVEGNTVLHIDNDDYELKYGECILIPAAIDAVQIKSTGEYTLLETFIP